LIKLFRAIDVVIIREHREEQTLAKLTWSNEKMVLVTLKFQHFNKPRLVNISVILRANATEIRRTIR
jgi:hypothetical protein